MAKKKSRTETKLDYLNELKLNTDIKFVKKELCKLLSSKNNIIAAKAAKVSADSNIRDLIKNLLSAFDYFMNNPQKNDKGCIAKEVIIESLDKMEYDQDDIFIRGINHHQFEPAYPKPVDTAGMLRAKSLFALYRLNNKNIFFILSDLLFDSELCVRYAAIKVLSQLCCDESELLLRVKIKAFDDEIKIIADCFSALMNINPMRSLLFIEKYLNSNDPIIAENAAFAIGESQSKEGLNTLIRFRENAIFSKNQNIVLLPVALTKLDKAFEYLIQVVENESKISAVAALKALKIYGHNEKYRNIIQKIVEKKKDDEILKIFEKEFIKE